MRSSSFFRLPKLERAPFVLLSAVALVATLSGCASAPDPAAESVVEVAKSPNDDRDYRYLTLSNELKVLLVSDPNTDKAAASLVAQRGSFHEPAGRQGIAHFLEHMLFIGTEKYPEVDAYQQFIGQNGGSSNAYTASDHTNYFFNINPPQFREAMDRFAQFFISPLFEDRYVGREKNAVHSEYQLQLKADGWRGNAAQKAALNPAHPGSLFNIGSLETLGGDIRGDLVEFFEANYSADQMILVALSNESLDELAAWVLPMFEAVENRNIGPAAPLPPMFASGQLPASMRIESIKDAERLTFEFPVPTERPYIRQKPLLYITNLLGHEGDGSLHQALKGRGWIESLSTGSSEFDENTHLVAIDLELTAAGAQQIPTITKAVFDQIDLLKTTPPVRRLYTEQAQMLELAFRFQEKSAPTAFVYRTAPALMQTEPAEVLRAPYLMTDFDPALIRRYLGYLTPQNLIRTHSGPEVETDQREQWFGVRYALDRGPVSQDEDFAVRLSLPAPNDFLPERVDLVKAPADPSPLPQRVVDREGIELWAVPDTRFGTPRANAFFTLAVQGGIKSVEDIVRAELYARLVSDSLNEFAYPAYLGGLSYRVSSSASGFEVRLSGYDDKQPLLLDKIIEAVASLKVDPARLALYRAELADDWRNFDSERPYTQSLAALTNLLVSSSWPPAALAAAVEQVDVASLESWVASRLGAVAVQGLVHGNVRAGRLDELAATFDSRLPIKAFPISRSTVFAPDKARRYGLDIDHQDASMVLYLQSESSSYDARAQTALAVALPRQSYFTALRTNDQLGYVVSVSYRPLRDRPGLAFIVQSPVADPQKLTERTYRFLTERLKELETLPEDAFEAYKVGLISNLLETPKNLSTRSSQLWGDLVLGELGFDTREQTAAAVRTITQAEAIAHLKELQEQLPKRQLLVYNTGKFNQEPTVGTPIETVSAFKQPG